jgi:VanZ family protein
VKAVGRLLAFGVGLAGGLALLVGLSMLNRGLWLPMALAIVLTALLYTTPWVRARGLAGVVSLALGSGICWGWLATSGSTLRRFDITYFPTALMSVIALFTSIAALAVVLYLPVKQRPPAWRLVVPVAMTWIVAILSSPAGAASPMMRWLTAHGLSATDAEVVVLGVRKTIHFTFYGMLALAAFSAAHAAKERRDLTFRFGLFFAGAVAAFDELRQMTAVGRTGSAYDVLLDLSGAAFFLWIAHLRTRTKPKKAVKRTASSTKAKS